MQVCYAFGMRTTITFNDKLFKTLKVYAASTGETVSSVVEDAVKNQLLEETDDIQEAKKRSSAPLASFDELVSEFKASGLL